MTSSGPKTRATVVVCALTIASLGVATAAIGRSARQAATPASSGVTIAEARKILLHPAEHFGIARNLVASNFASTSGRKRVSREVNAITGGYAYLTEMTTRDSDGDFFDSSSVVSRVIRVDTATGSRTVIHTARGAVLAVSGAAPERAWIFQLSLREGDDTFSIATKTLTAAVTDPLATELNSGVMSVRLHSGFNRREEICGKLVYPSGVSDTGEAIATSIAVEPECSDFEHLRIAAQLIAPDGTTRTIEGHASFLNISGEDVQVRGDNAIYASRGSNLARRQLSTGMTTGLWDGGTRANPALADDGSVALVAEGEYSAYAGGRPRRERDAFIVFSPGDSDHPIVVSPSSPRTHELHYCGNRLYELRETRLVDYDGSRAWTRRKLRVVERNTLGSFVAVRATVRASKLETVGCDGGVLLAASLKGQTVTVSRYGQ